MKYSAAVLSMAAAVAARPAFTNLSFDVQEGQPFTLEFTGCEGGCTINLKNGEENDLQDVQQITSNADGGSFTFSLDSLPSDTYTFEIVNNDTGEDNYSEQFQYEGEAATATTTAETETLTTSVPETTSSTPSTTEETSTETSTVAETTTMTSPSASTTASPTESTTASEDSTSTTDGAEATQTSEIPAPEDAAIALGSPLTFVVAAVAGLLMFN